MIKCSKDRSNKDNERKIWNFCMKKNKKSISSIIQRYYIFKEKAKSIFGVNTACFLVCTILIANWDAQTIKQLYLILDAYIGHNFSPYVIETLYTHYTGIILKCLPSGQHVRYIIPMCCNRVTITIDWTYVRTYLINAPWLNCDRNVGNLCSRFLGFRDVVKS